MKSRLFLMLPLLLVVIKDRQVMAQQQPSFLTRAYWDNDLFNIRGNGTDESYTNGLRFDVYHKEKNAPRTFSGEYFPLLVTVAST